jgi:hypothetical protein
MKKEIKYVKIDSRNRLTIPKNLSEGMSHLYKIYEQNGKIILEPVHDVPKEEQWLFDPKNKAIVDELKAALKEKAYIRLDLSEFETEDE